MNTAPRRTWLAGLLSAFCTGLGHLYAGRPAVAVVLNLAGLASGVAMAFAFTAGPRVSAVIALGALGFWFGQIVHAAWTTRRRASLPRTRASHPLALVGFTAAAFTMSSVVLPFVRAKVAHAVFVPSGAMIPTVQIGDYLVVATPRAPLRRGDLVVHAAPAGNPRSDPLLKRIVGVGGDTIAIVDGHLLLNGQPVPYERAPGTCLYQARPEGGAWHDEPCVDFIEKLEGRAYHTYCTPHMTCGDVEPSSVPTDMLWVAGDHRDHSADSRVYGPVPESAVVGEARWVILSWGPDGVRWDRIGLELR